MRNLTIDGITKLLAYGDFIEARATKRNVALDEEVAKYPYSRKSELKVCEYVFQNKGVCSATLFVQCGPVVRATVMSKEN